MNPEIAVEQKIEPELPQPAVVEQKIIKDRRRHYLAAFFFSFFFGIWAVDRFYLGKVWTGILKFITFGGFGIWAIIDLSLITSGAMRDKQGNEMIDAAKYKKLAKRTISIFSLVTIFIFLVITALIVLISIQFINSGGIEKITSDITNSVTQSVTKNVQDQAIKQITNSDQTPTNTSNQPDIQSLINSLTTK